mmetsp:Transcript_28935/g.61657  ORF Transcript_28935/g.61657 Transcript_28935/m.61657 type:complete len:519 (-) Transcript_28935:152-1708(-)
MGGGSSSCAAAAAAAYKPRAPKDPREPLGQIFEHIDGRVAEYVALLEQAVGIPSISAEPGRRPQVFEMVRFYTEYMTKLGVQHELRELGKHLCNGQELDLPPVIVGRYGEDANKPTICVYGHLDVQPAAKEDGWNTDPFVLTYAPRSEEEDAAAGYGDFPSGGKLFGRGSTDDKAPALAWLIIIEAFQTLKLDFPVNLLFLVESMEESGSEGLDNVVEKEFAEGGFLEKAEAICVADNNWLGTRKPCIQYGLRGICYFFLEVAGPIKDLHSGRFGGSVHEPMVDLVNLLQSLVDTNGNILVPGVLDSVKKLTPEEEKLYEGIDFPLEGQRQASGCEKLMHNDDQKKALMHIWRYPALSVHGIEGCHSGPGAKTVIPAKVTGKFSIRLVPDQDPRTIEELVEKHCEAVFKKLGSPNHIKIYSEHGAKGFSGDPSDTNYSAARKAVECVYGVAPDLTRSGGSIPVALTMQETGRSVVLFPMGRNDDGHHGQNEKLDLNNFMCGIKAQAAYLVEFAAGKAK